MSRSRSGYISRSVASLVALVAVVSGSTLVSAPASAAPDGSGPVISEIYVNGGSKNAPYSNKYVELYNPTDSDIDLDGWSIQYRAPQAITNFSKFNLAGTIPAGGYLLIKGGSNGQNGQELPGADVVIPGFQPGNGGGIVALSDADDALPGTLRDDVVGSDTDHLIDLVGYGTATTYETAAAPAPAATDDPKSVSRSADVIDTDSNAADFTLTAQLSPCGKNGCADPITEPEEPTEPTALSIAEVQGNGDTTPYDGQQVTVEGVVTAAYPSGGFNGVYLQTAGTGGTYDPDATNSNGIFVYSQAMAQEVTVGQAVTVTGTASEYYGLTEITPAAGGWEVGAEAAEPVTPTTVTLPLTSVQREALEGMLISLDGDYTITDNYDANTYGEITLAAGTEPLRQPTDVVAPGTAEYDALVAENADKSITLDDGASANYTDGAKNTPNPWLTADNEVRIGQSATVTQPVVLDYRFDLWRAQPTAPVTAEGAKPVEFGQSTREETPSDVGGAVKISSFNVLNYFSTTGEEFVASGAGTCTYYNDRDGAPLTARECTPDGPRGAANDENLQRQQAKIVAAINSLGADVVALEEIENSAAFGQDRDAALDELVTALNAAAGEGTWVGVDSPATVPETGEDVIRTAFIYRADAVEPVGDSAILDDPAFTNARAPLAQTFSLPGEADSSFVVIANHFKSKGSGEGEDADTGDGQGASNHARVQQATALVAFADERRTEGNTDQVFLVGDFNSYTQEDPLKVLTDAGYVNVGDELDAGDTYSFDGRVGSLDHIFASSEAFAKVTGADVWDINADESVGREYSRYNQNATLLYDESVFRASDHDPTIVGYDPAAEAQDGDTTIALLGINDFHGRIDANTIAFAGTIEQLRAEHGEESTLFLSSGDNIGASLFASATQGDLPTIEILNALDLAVSNVGNHEFDKGVDDLLGRVEDAADFSYLAANVKGADGEPILPAYEIFSADGVDVAVIGAVTQETPSLVSPAGVEGLEFTDPVEAVNETVAELEALDDAPDVIVASYHEGAGAGTPDGSDLDTEIAAGGAFADIVTETDAEVDAIFTAHTHKQYVWEGPVPGEEGQTRPIVQTGSYGEFIGEITLTIDDETGDVVAHTADNVARTTTPNEELRATFPRVEEVATITEAALEHADEVGSEQVAEITGDITTAFVGETRDDRSKESTLGNLVAESMLQKAAASPAGADLAVVNPGGLRAELLYGDDGIVTFAEANAVLPFVNNISTVTLTGESLKKVFEQQWQRAADGTVPSRPYLQLGTSENVSYTFDPNRPEGDRITSLWVDGVEVDPTASYKVAVPSFLASGGDNFHAFTEGTAVDTGLVDYEAWVEYLGDNSPVEPNFARHAVQVTGADSALTSGGPIEVTISELDLTSLGTPASTQATAALVDAEGTRTELGSFPVSEGSATVTGTLPASVTGDVTLEVSVDPAGTLTRIPLQLSMFNDIGGNTFADEINWLASTGVTTGYVNADGTISYHPSDAVLREQMAAFLYRFEHDGGNPEEGAETADFTDVPNSHVFSSHIAWLADTGITTGYDDGTFRPGQPVLREQMAAFLYRLAGSPMFIAPEESPFTDLSTSHTFYKEITWLASTGITTGYEEADGTLTFRGSEPVLREQMAAFLFRYSELENAEQQ